MKYRLLIRQSTEYLKSHPDVIYTDGSFKLFADGGMWMHDRLREMDDHRPIPALPIKFNYYGLLKYGICLIALFVSAFLFYRVSILFTPLAVIVFYWCEVHFLFLFPLIIDGVKNPVAVSIQQTYRLGILHALFNVIPIGVYMLSGLVNLQHPFRRWYIGCLCIVIWYQNDVRNRL